MFLIFIFTNQKKESRPTNIYLCLIVFHYYYLFFFFSSLLFSLLSVINRNNRRIPSVGSNHDQMLNSINNKQVNKVKPNVNRHPDSTVVSPSTYNRWVKFLMTNKLQKQKNEYKINTKHSKTWTPSKGKLHTAQSLPKSQPAKYQTIRKT